jgi:hypothetical protein
MLHPESSTAWAAAVRKRCAEAASLVLFFALLAGCGASNGGTDGEPTIGELPTVLDAKDIRLPFDAYSDTGQDRTNAWTAMQMVGRDCMRRLGLDWMITPLGPQQNEKTQYARRYGIFIDAEVRQWGYGTPPEQDSRREEKPPQVRLDKIQTDVWTGAIKQLPSGQEVPAGGCSGEASRKLSGNRPEVDRSFAEKLANQAYKSAESDSRMTAAVKSWSVCMGTRGYTYKSPWGPNDQEWPKTSGAVSPVELSTAIADLECRRSVRLVDLWYALEVAYQNRLIEANSEALADTKKYFDERKRRTSEVIGG